MGLMLRLRGRLRTWHDAKAVDKPEVTPAMTKGEDDLLCDSIHKHHASVWDVCGSDWSQCCPAPKPWLGVWCA